MRWLGFVVLLVACTSARPPTVPRSDLARIPAEWTTTWAPAQDKASAASDALVQAREAERGPAAQVADLETALKSAERDVAEAESAQKDARKSSDPEALRAATDWRTQALAAQTEAERELRVARAELALAQAVTASRAAEHRIAAAKLELIKAQAAIDAGVWMEIERFATEVDQAQAAIAPAAEAEERARAAVVLAGQ